MEEGRTTVTGSPRAAARRTHCTARKFVSS